MYESALNEYHFLHVHLLQYCQLHPAGNHGSLYPSRTGSSGTALSEATDFSSSDPAALHWNCDNNIPEPPAPIPRCFLQRMLRRLLAAAPSFLPSRCKNHGIYCFDPFWLPGTMGADGNYDLKQDPSWPQFPAFHRLRSVLPALPLCPLLPLLYNSHWHHIHCRN